MIVDRRRLSGTITRLRKQQQLTQQQLADRARIPRSTVSHLERGDWLPDLPNAVAIADALGITVDELIGEAR